MAADYSYGDTPNPAKSRPEDDAPDTFDDLDGPGGDLDGPVSDLEALAAELDQDVDLAASITLDVPGRPGYAVEYRADVNARELDHWRKKAKNRNAADGFDMARFSSLIVVNTCLGVIREGTPVELEDRRTGRFVRASFAEREFVDVLRVPSPSAAASKLYGRDASIIAAAQAILEASGYNDTALATADPQ